MPPNILRQCQLIPCSRQEACTAVSPKLELHTQPALCPEVLAAQGGGKGRRKVGKMVDEAPACLENSFFRVEPFWRLATQPPLGMKTDLPLGQGSPASER